MNSWYSRQYLGKSFDRFLKSKMTLKDFMQLQEVLQQVLVQLQARRAFIENGSRNKTGAIHIRTNEERASLSMMNPLKR